MGCWDIFVFGQVTKNEYIQYLYSAWLQGTNILDIRIRKRSEYENIRYSYVVKSYYEDIRSCRPWPTGSRNCSCICIKIKQILLKIYFIGGGGHQKFGLYIFDIHICSYCSEQIYSIIWI